MSSPHITFPGAAFALTLAVAAVPAFGATPDAVGETVQVEFRHDPARLVTREGAEQTYRDIRFAAQDACRREAPSAQRSVNRTCEAEVVDAMVARINNGHLSSVHTGQPGADLASRS